LVGWCWLGAVAEGDEAILVEQKILLIKLLEVGLYMRSHIQELEGVSEILLLIIVISLLSIEWRM
jgi:hypothetical protein